MNKKLALISVSDKTGLEKLARALDKAGFEIASTGGTAKAIQEAGIKTIPVEKLTGFPEMLEGRVKTLHPGIHAGILARQGRKEDMASLKRQGIRPIQVVVVNLYPFSEKVSGKASLEEAIENIDIGGPSMARAAAKNYESVAVVTSPSQYASIIEELERNQGISLEKRRELAAKAFELTAFYDAAVSAFLRGKFLASELFPQRLTLAFEKDRELRYGENWHQKAALYKQPFFRGPAISNTEQLHGKEMSFNNFNDASAAIGLVNEFSEPTAAIIKHTNPCGVASHKNLDAAFKNALDCDKTSAFGSVIALNRQCDSKTAQQIVSFFNEIVVAPSFEEAALGTLKEKKNLRILRLPGLDKPGVQEGLKFRFLEGGMLAQTPDNQLFEESQLRQVSKRKPSENEKSDLVFAWKVAKHVKSNAIVLVKGLATTGIGAGQMSRIDATELAVKKSGGRHRGSVLASDTFFPFRDNVDIAAKSGVTAVIQPGNSVRDEEVIKAVDEHGMAMLFTGFRHFRH